MIFMHFSKRYGEYKVERCPFCKKQATSTNSDGMPVCYEHKNESMPLLKCMCGETLDMMTGKFGVFFKCIRCGIVRKNRALEMNEKAFLVSDVNSSVKTSSSFSSSKRKDENKKQEESVLDDSDMRCSFITQNQENYDESKEKTKTKPRSAPREITVRADDPYYCR
jgi:hypothetical protein